MDKGNGQLFFEDVNVGDLLPSVSIPITLQRLVIEAGANQDFSSIHHDRDVARATGAPDSYMNFFFIMGMFERLLREWIGLRGEIKKIGPFRMKVFNCADDVVTFNAEVIQKREDNEKGDIFLDVWSETHRGQTVSGKAVVTLPEKN